MKRRVVVDADFIDNPFDLKVGDIDASAVDSVKDDAVDSADVVDGSDVEKGDADNTIDTDTQNENVTDSDVEERADSDDSDASGSDLNLVRSVAEMLKSEGFIDDDVDVDNIQSKEDLDRAFIDSYRRQIEDRIKEEIISEYGLNSFDDLETIRKRKYGIPSEELQLLETYRILASVDLDEADIDSIRKFFENYYLDRGLSEDEAKLNAERDINDGYEQFIEKRKRYFANRYEELKRRHEEIIKKRREEERRRHEETINEIKKILKKGEFEGVKYDRRMIEEFERALFNPTEVIEINGKKVRVTPYQKKMYERSKNLEVLLHDAFRVYFNIGSDVKKARKIKKSIVDSLNKNIVKDVDGSASTISDNSVRVNRVMIN